MSYFQRTFSPGVLALALSLLPTLTLAKSTANVTWQAAPYVLPAVPLVVKSPYPSAWARGTNELAGQWPSFATGGVLGSTCYIKVDNTTYTIWGNPGTGADTVARQTYIRASQKYISTLVEESTASDNHEWVTGDNDQPVKWSTEADANTIIHKMTLQNPTVYGESHQRAQWGTLYFASNQTRYNDTQGDGTTWQIGQDTVVRQQFLSTGKLGNTQDTNFRKVSDNWPVMAFAQDLGNVSPGFARGTTLVLGHLRNPAVQYQTPTGPEDRSLYFTSKISTEDDALRFVLNNWVPAVNESTNFGAKIITEGEEISPDYMSVLSASTLQAFAGIELTVPRATKDIQDTKLFIKDSAMKEDGSSMPGVFSSVNSLYSIMPMLIYTNPRLGSYGLKSLLEYAKFYNQPFASHDIGLHYGEAVVHPNQRGSRTDSTASMIIMTYAFMRYTGDAELAAVHYDTLKTWADYLVDNALFHLPEVTGDWFVGDAAGPAGNMTNVALKGLIALRSMAEIQNSLIDQSSESSKYLNAANSGLEQWIQLSDYGTKFTYQSSTEQSDTKQYLLHALYADKLLGLNFVPESVYERQRAQYMSGMKRYGVPITNANNFTTIAHQYFTIAALSASNSAFASNSTFIAIKNYTEASVNANLTALADTYDAETGVAVAGAVARGSVGGAYAVLALRKGEVKSINPIRVPSSNSAGRIATINILVIPAALISTAFLS
ncbi:hypothetical protein FRC11_006266 [Ceratobasidium sp. 423]|nr:hypothetical protein FRC11_006266 [Ceratobasidium sp. 423]